MNDFDMDGDELTVISTTEPNNGWVEFNTDNTVTYYPSTGFSGDDCELYHHCLVVHERIISLVIPLTNCQYSLLSSTVFKYTISDGCFTAEATVIVSVVEPAQPALVSVKPTMKPTYSLPDILPCSEMCFKPLNPDECPSCDPVILPSCSNTTLEIGALCESDGECGLDDQLNNCEGTFDVYRRVSCSRPGVCMPREDGEIITISANGDAYVVADNNRGYDTDTIIISEVPRTDSVIRWELTEDVCECVTIKKVTLRLYVVNPGRLGGFVHVINPNWDESTISWSGAPDSSGPPLVQIGDARNGTWVDADVTGLISNSDEQVAVRIKACLKNSVGYASKDYMQGKFAPQIIIEFGPPPAGMYLLSERSQMQQLSHYGRRLGSGTTKVSGGSGDIDDDHVDDEPVIQELPVCPDIYLDLSATNSLYVTGDSTIVYRDQDSSFGSDILLELSPPQCGDMHAMLNFNVSSLTNGHAVEYASILIHVIEGSDLSGATFLHAPVPNWTEDTLTWRTAPEYDTFVGSLNTIQSGMVRN